MRQYLVIKNALSAATVAHLNACFESQLQDEKPEGALTWYRVLASRRVALLLQLCHCSYVDNDISGTLTASGTTCCPTALSARGSCGTTT